MGYTTDFEGSIKVKRRALAFNLKFSADETNKEQQNDDEDEFNLENIDCHLFELILSFGIFNQSISSFNSLRLVSINIYFLCCNVNQNKLFPTVDTQTVALINGLAESRRMIRYRYINGVDYGMDGQYFIDTDNFGQFISKYSTLYDGRPLDYNQAPRTQPGLWQQWIFNEKDQCIEWNGEEKFYDYVEWLVYLINNILNPKYELFGEIKWSGQDPDDSGIISIENDGQNVVQTNPLDDFCHLMSKTKQKDIVWREHVFRKWSNRDSMSAEEEEKILNIINDETWIENHKTLKNYSELLKIVKSEKRKLDDADNDNQPSRKNLRKI